MWIKYFIKNQPQLLNLDHVAKIEPQAFVGTIIFFGSPESVDGVDSFPIVDIFEFKTTVDAEKAFRIIESCIIDKLPLLVMETEKYNLVE